MKTKRIKIWAGLLVFSVLLASKCKKLDRFTQFDLTYHSQATIPAGIPVNTPYNIPTPPITTNSTQSFENNNTHKDLIQEIKLKEAVLTITDPANGDFSFLNSIEIYIKTDDLPEKKIAWKTNIPDTVGNTLELETTGEDLKDYLTEDEFSLRLKTTTDQILTRDYEVDIKTVFHVNAKILGI